MYVLLLLRNFHWFPVTLRVLEYSPPLLATPLSFLERDSFYINLLRSHARPLWVELVHFSHFFVLLLPDSSKNWIASELSMCWVLVKPLSGLVSFLSSQEPYKVCTPFFSSLVEEMRHINVCKVMWLERCGSRMWTWVVQVGAHVLNHHTILCLWISARPLLTCDHYVLASLPSIRLRSLRAGILITETPLI